MSGLDREDIENSLAIKTDRTTIKGRSVGMFERVLGVASDGTITKPAVACFCLLVVGAAVTVCSAAGSEGGPAALRDAAGGGRLWTEAGV